MVAIYVKPSEGISEEDATRQTVVHLDRNSGDRLGRLMVIDRQALRDFWLGTGIEQRVVFNSSRLIRLTAPGRFPAPVDNRGLIRSNYPNVNYSLIIQAYGDDRIGEAMCLRCRDNTSRPHNFVFADGCRQYTEFAGGACGNCAAAGEHGRCTIRIGAALPPPERMPAPPRPAEEYGTRRTSRARANEPLMDHTQLPPVRRRPQPQSQPQSRAQPPARPQTRSRSQPQAQPQPPQHQSSSPLTSLASTPPLSSSSRPPPPQQSPSPGPSNWPSQSPTQQPPRSSFAPFDDDSESISGPNSDYLSDLENSMRAEVEMEERLVQAGRSSIWANPSQQAPGQPGQHNASMDAIEARMLQAGRAWTSTPRQPIGRTSRQPNTPGQRDVSMGGMTPQCNTPRQSTGQASRQPNTPGQRDISMGGMPQTPRQNTVERSGRLSRIQISTKPDRIASSNDIWDPPTDSEVDQPTPSRRSARPRSGSRGGNAGNTRGNRGGATGNMGGNRGGTTGNMSGMMGQGRSGGGNSAGMTLSEAVAMDQAMQRSRGQASQGRGGQGRGREGQ